MKINSIQRDITLKSQASGFHSGSPKLKEKHADMCGRGMNTDYCGSFTGKSEAATSFVDKVMKSNLFGKFTKYSEEHNVATSALIALVLAGILRPATIMALPGDKDKEDKIYASGHAIASGIIGFIVSTIVTSPFDESIKKIFEKDENGNRIHGRKKFEQLNKDIEELKKKPVLTELEKQTLENLKGKRGALKTFVKWIPDWVIGVPRAMLTIALIPPILKYVFGLEKKKKEPPKEDNMQQANIETSNIKLDEKPVFAAFKGGVQ